MPEVGNASETDRVPDAERAEVTERPQADDRASEVRNWFQPVSSPPSAEAGPAEASPAEASPAEASPAEASPAEASPVRDSRPAPRSAERNETEPDTIILPKLRVSRPRAQNGTAAAATSPPEAAGAGQPPAEAKTVPSAPAPAPSAPAPAKTPSSSAPAGPKRIPPLGDGRSDGRAAAGKTRAFYSGSKSPAWPDVLNETEPATVILPKLVVSRPPAHNGKAAASSATPAAAKTETAGQHRAAEGTAVRPDLPAEPETMLLPILPGSRSQAPTGTAAGSRPSRDAVAASPGATRNGPAKFIASLSRRLSRATKRHRPLIVVLVAIAAVATAATVISVRLDASPRPSGAPPLDIPSAGGQGQLAQVAVSGTWPTTPPASVPATCQQVSLKGLAGASVISYLDDNSSQHNLVAKEAKGLGLLDFSWTSLASATDVVRTDSFGPSLTTELTAADQSGPCGLRFATLSDNDPTLSHSADVRLMTKILTSSSVRQANVLAVAQWMASQPLATGLTIDYENGLPQNLGDIRTAERAAGWSGLSLDESVNRLSNDYTELIGEIAAALHRQHRLVRLMAPVRYSDDVDVATTDVAPYLLNYGALAQYVDQIVLKAYDFHYATGNPGPIAPFADVAKVLTYVHSYRVPWSKLAVAAPLYAYDWTVNKNGAIALGAKGQPISATTLTATKVAAGKKRWHQEKTENGETEYAYTRAGQMHVVWDASSALKTEMAWLKRNYPQIGIDASNIGNADPAGSTLAVTALGS